MTTYFFLIWWLKNAEYIQPSLAAYARFWPWCFLKVSAIVEVTPIDEDLSNGEDLETWEKLT